MKKGAGKAARIFLVFATISVLAVFSIDFYVKKFSSSYMLSKEEAEDIYDVDCILVLGAGIWGEEPSPMLRDRLDLSTELYEAGCAPKILMSGDHGKKDYDEVNIMKQYAENLGVPSENIFMDHAGFSTYESMYRAKDVFGVKKMIIVTQGYHMYRALYVANNLGILAYGVVSDQRTYAGQEYRELREIMARNKDFIASVFKPLPKYLGEEIYIGGDGNLTNDK